MCSSKTSMIGRVRLLARYARPMSRMNTMGEWEGRFFGLSVPCESSAPPMTVTFGRTALMASYVSASTAS